MLQWHTSLNLVKFSRLVGLFQRPRPLNRCAFPSASGPSERVAFNVWDGAWIAAIHFDNRRDDLVDHGMAWHGMAWHGMALAAGFRGIMAPVLTRSMKYNGIGESGLVICS
jgi:hypothetical protein